MKKKSSRGVTFDESRDRWLADIPASVSQTGKRIRAWFKTRDEAREYLDDIKDTDTPSAIIPPQLAMQADQARMILEPFGIDLVQAARDYAAVLGALGDSGTPLQAAQAYRAAHNARIASKPLGEAVKAYLVTCEKLRPATLRGYRYTLERLLAPLNLRPMADITTADLEALLAPMADSSRALHKRTLNAFWKWAGHTNRAWCSMDAVKGLEAPRVTSDADILTLTPAEVRALLTAAEVESPAAALAYAVAVFGGVRMNEIAMLKWRDIGPHHITIGKHVAKKHARRLVPICPTLRAWIDACKGSAEDGDPITPPNWVEVTKNVRRRAGWAVAVRTPEVMPKPTRGSWPANSPRHTCASVQVAIGAQLEALIFSFGHGGGYDLLRSHYVGRMTEKTALEILAIGPSGSKVKLMAAV